MVKRTGSNQFIALDRQRQELEIQLSTLDNLRSQKQTLEQTQAGGNEYLIQNYEAAQKQIEKLKSQEATLKADIQRLEKRIHQLMYKSSKNLILNLILWSSLNLCLKRLQTVY